jgi:hypothetical protein
LGVCGGDVTRRDPRNTNGDERLDYFCLQLQMVGYTF